jgi:hypothetical protein
MLKRVIIAGVAAGVVVFIAGAMEHMALQWGDRAMKPLPKEAEVLDFIKSQNLTRGLYSFPEEKRDVAAADRDKAWDELNAKYKAGPNGLLLIGPTGEDMMGPVQLGGELTTNIIAALFAAWIVSLLRPDVGFRKRWLVVLLIGECAWLSQNASYGLWYRFPHELIHDELLCVLLEWSLAGLVIAKIVKPESSPAVAA